MSAKGNKKAAKNRAGKKEEAGERPFRLQEPILTALYSKLGRLGYEA